MPDLTTHKLLQRVSLNVDTVSTVTFSSIPQTGYTDLKLVVSARGTQAAGYNALTLKLNSDTTNYSTKELVGDGSNPGNASRSALGSAMYVGNMTGNSATSKTYSVIEIYLPNYTSNKNKNVSVTSATENAAAEAYLTTLAGLWSSSSAITTIDLVALAAHGTFMAGSTFSLYGISALGTTPSSPSADGGDIVVSDGSFWYHAFLNSGTFTPKSSLTCAAMVIAGGGGGYNGGGGAGGFRLGTGLSVTATAYPVVIGAGGATGKPGSNSSFSTLSATGGGALGTSASTTKNGGSGAGADSYGGVAGTGNAGGYTPVEGYAGGATGTFSAGGGGGAGGVGAGSPGTSQGGAGGVGAGGSSYTNYTIINSMGTATKTGVLSSSNYYYAGGGGGGAGSTGPVAGAGGLGGGGTGGANTVGPWPGIMNTGSGGGGGWSLAGAAGGSGIVIIRYPV